MCHKNYTWDDFPDQRPRGGKKVKSLIKKATRKNRTSLLQKIASLLWKSRKTVAQRMAT